ncbi:MAG TPA: hypothetical protein VGM40_02815 [Mycobacterium sp.]
MTGAQSLTLVAVAYVAAIAVAAGWLAIPMMEKRSLARRPDYQRVIDGVSRFIRLPAHKMVT